MKNQSKALILMMLFSIGLAATIAFFQPATASAFDIKLGIVGNLGSAQCRATGDCTLCDFIDLFTVLQKVILSIFAGLALLMLIWGGQGMIMAAGNQEKFTASRKLITSTLFGVLIILAAYFLTNILYSILTSPSKTNAPTCAAQNGTIVSSPDPINNKQATCGAGLTQINASDVTKPNACCKPAILSEYWWKKTLGCDVSNICASPNKCFDKSCLTGDEDLGQRNCNPGWKCCNVACASPNTCQTNCPAAKNMGPRSCDTNKGETCCQP